MWNKREYSDHTSLRYSEDPPFPKVELLNWILDDEEEQASCSFLRKVKVVSLPSGQKAQKKQHLTSS